MQDALRDAAEEPRRQLPSTRPTEHDEVRLEASGLRKYAFGHPVDDGVPHATASCQAGHAELEDGSVGNERGILAALA